MARNNETLIEAIDRIVKASNLRRPTTSDYQTISATLSASGKLRDLDIQAACWEVLREPLKRVV